MLQVRNLSHWFGDVKVLDQINFTLNRGQRAGLIGPNGSGKSTLLKIITGELRPDQGSVQLSPATLRLGYLPQALDFPPDATVSDPATVQIFSASDFMNLRPRRSISSLIVADTNTV